jgi:TRAP-type C4-dicarboxylate transport system permease small subunit
MEGGLAMLLHSAIIAVILYIIMRYALKQSQPKSVDRSLLLGAIVFIYMILFGHGLPKNINENIFS